MNHEIPAYDPEDNSGRILALWNRPDIVEESGTDTRLHFLLTAKYYWDDEFRRTATDDPRNDSAIRQAWQERQKAEYEHLIHVYPGINLLPPDRQ